MAFASSFTFRNGIGVGLLSMGLAGMGCALDATGGDFEPDEEQIAEARQGIAGDPNTQNQLEPACSMDNGIQQTVRDFGGTRLTSTYTGYLKNMPYMPSAYVMGELQGCRREYLKVLFGCALASGDTITDPNDLVVNPFTGASSYKTYAGEVGLAPNWKTSSTGLTTDEKERVTACVMARTNRFGEVINISLQGDAPLASDPAALGYPYVESVVWGNMFDSTTPLNPTRDPNLPTAERPFDGHVCQAYNVTTCPDAALRVCDTEDCGFISHGTCSRMCDPIGGTIIPRGCEAWSNRITIYLQAATLVCPIEYGTYQN